VANFDFKSAGVPFLSLTRASSTSHNDSTLYGRFKPVLGGYLTACRVLNWVYIYIDKIPRFFKNLASPPTWAFPVFNV
jgi:hypothetical protein